MGRLLQDLRFAIRQVLRNPGFSLTAVLSLTLGIGATVAVYSILYDAVLHPWPYAGIERVGDIFLTNSDGNDGFFYLTGPQIRQLRQTQSLEDVAAFDSNNQVLTGSEMPEDVATVSMTGTAFQFLGMPPLMGRSFTPSDAPDGQDPQPVAVLGYSFWQRHYQGDTAVVGKSIQIAHKNYAILGVMPPRFTWMDGDVYLPLKLPTDMTHRFGTKMKLKPGVSFTTAGEEIAPLYPVFDRQTPNIFPKKYKVNMRPLVESYTHDLKKTMLMLFAAVALLLAIGCGNLAILLLARGTARQHEFAIRAAVGASSSRIVRQLLTESLVLSLTGAGFGVLVAYQSIGFIVPRLPDYSYPNEASFHINLPVLVFSVGLAVLAGIVFGLFPALQSAKPEISQVMQAGTRRLMGGVKGKRLHTALIAGQIALTLVLMTAAGGAIQAFIRMNTMHLGYEPQHVMSVGLPIGEDAHTTLVDRTRYYEQLRAKIAELPGVLETGISTNATPPDSGWNQTVDILGQSAAQAQNAHVEFVSPGYFSLLRIPLLKGRMWDQSEMQRGAAMVLVNQAFVKRYLSGGEALGHSVKLPELNNLPPGVAAGYGIHGYMPIIGVVADSLDDGLDKPVAPAIYTPYSLFTFRWTQILVRTQAEPLSMLQTIRRQIATVDPDQQVIRQVRDLNGWIQHQPEFQRGRLISMLFGAFAVLALTLAAVGLFSVVSYTVLQRTGEFGIRVALGAKRGNVLGLVALSAATSVGVGIVAGLALSYGLNRMLARWIESGTRDPFMALAASCALILVAAVACLIPARRALAIDPMIALRSE